MLSIQRDKGAMDLARLSTTLAPLGRVQYLGSTPMFIAPTLSCATSTFDVLSDVLSDQRHLSPFALDLY